MTSPSGADANPRSEPRSPSAEELCSALLAGGGALEAVSLDSLGQIARWGGGAERLFGHPASEALGRPASVLYAEEERAAGAPEMHREQAKLATGPERAWMVRKDGGRFPADIKWLPVQGDDEQLTGFLLIVRDVTARLRREARLRLLEAVVTGANDAVVITDVRSRIEYVNAAYTRITGYTPEEVVGRRPSEFLHGPGTDVEASARIRDAVKRGAPIREEMLNYRKDGSPFWIELSIVPVRDERGRAEHWASVQRDITERRHMLEELERLRRQQALILASAGEGIVGLDAEGRTTFVNPAAVAMLGWNEEELLGKVQHDLVHHSRADGSPYPIEECPIQASLRDGGRHHEEGEVFWRKDGTKLPVEYTATPMMEDGRVAGAVIVFEDVSQRRQAEETEHRFTAILEATPDCIWIAEPDGRMHYLNRAGREMVGVGPEGVEAMTIWDLHPDWAASRLLRDAVPTAMRTGLWHGEAALRHRDGHLTPVSQVVLAHPGPGGEVAYLSSIARDITARIRLEEVHKFMAEASRELSMSLDYGATLRTIADRAIPDLCDYCTIDLMRNGGVIHRDTAVHRDPDKSELMGRLSRFPPDLNGRLGAAGVFRSGESELVAEVTPAWLRAVSVNEVHHALLDELAPRSELIVPLRVRNRVIGVITLGRVGTGQSYTREDLYLAEDFSSRAALALDNARLYRDTQQAMHMRDEVLGIVAHDLRNPIHTIHMGGELLLESIARDDEPPRRQLQIILRSAERANELIQDLLDVARMEAGRLKVDLETIGLATVVEQTVELHRTQAQERKLELVVDLPRDLPRIRADRARLQQVFENLLGNAFKFTPEGGRITITAEANPTEVYVTVADTGVGISEKEIPHLFDPFWQANKSPGEGAGLGLPIAKGILEAHGGRIWAEGSPGKGAKFHFAIPRADRRADAAVPVDWAGRWRTSPEVRPPRAD